MDLDEILAALKGIGPIPREQVRVWSGSEDLEALGALYHAVTEPSFCDRVTPPLTNDDVFPFLRAYLARCLREDRDGDWANSRYSAGWDLVGWIKHDREDPELLAEWKAWLEPIYRDGTPEIRECLITATLEHAFEEPRIAAFFADWKSDPLLAEAYVQAVEWSERGGTSPL